MKIAFIFDTKIENDFGLVYVGFTFKKSRLNSHQMLLINVLLKSITFKLVVYDKYISGQEFFV